MDESRNAPVSMPRVSAPGVDPLVGRVISDRYRVLALVARGGMGKVYRAEQRPLGRLVALKVLNASYEGEHDPEFHRRFFLEASIASKLTHPNTVTIFDYGKTDDDIYYIAMELLEGRTLHRALREDGVFSAERAMHIGRQICRSLREAHGLGVIHRDLKPANVFLVQHGDEKDFVKVLDFGLVKKVEDKTEEHTQTGLFMGSPKYMSPEQIRGDAVDVRADVYSLGVILYEMLTGRVPFERTSSVNILMAHIQDRVPSMGEANPSVRVPPALENVVRKCMAKDPAERYGSFDEVLSALKRCAGFSGSISDEHGEPSQLWQAPPSQSPRPLVHVPGELLSGAGASPSAQSVRPSRPPAPVPEASARKVAPLMFALIVVAAVGAGVLRSRRIEPSEPTVTPPAAAAREESVPAAQQTELVPRPPLPAPTALGDVVQAAPVATVLVSLRSTPSGAMVVVNGKEYGPTPAQLEWSGPDAAPGREVTFRFQRKGYRDLTVTRQIRGDRLEVEAPPMDPVPVRRPTRAPRPVNGASKVPDGFAPLKGYKEDPY